MENRIWALVILFILIVGGGWFTLLFGPPPAQGETVSHLTRELWTLYKIVMMVYIPFTIIILIWPSLWPFSREEK